TTIWSLERGSEGAVTVVTRTAELTPDAGSIGSVVSFAEDGVGELYLIDYDGEIFRIGTADSLTGNLSTRARLGAVSNVAIAGFVLEGEGRADLLIRGVGPGLADFQVIDPLVDPRFAVFENPGTGGSVRLLENEDWDDSGAAPAVREAEAVTGAFALEDGSTDAAAVLSLPAGSYTEVLRAGAAEEGIGLVEVYRMGPSAGQAMAPILRNISTRAAVEAGGGRLIAGFVLEGTGSRQFLIRGIGPGLEDFGVTGVITDPVLEVLPLGSGTVLAGNDDWDSGPGTAGMIEAAESVGAFPLMPGSGDASLLLRLAPGSYTARIRSADGQPGVGLVEIYLLSD
ncbi:MAG: hypothetical protein R3F07_20645, partial [Opitutaceae bacterium]